MPSPMTMITQRTIASSGVARHAWEGGLITPDRPGAQSGLRWAMAL